MIPLVHAPAASRSAWSPRKISPIIRPSSSPFGQAWTARGCHQRAADLAAMSAAASMREDYPRLFESPVRPTGCQTRGPEAEISPGAGSALDQPARGSGGGYDGPLAYRMGKPCRTFRAPLPGTPERLAENVGRNSCNPGGRMIRRGRARPLGSGRGTRIRPARPGGRASMLPSTRLAAGGRCRTCAACPGILAACRIPKSWTRRKSCCTT